MWIRRYEVDSSRFGAKGFAVFAHTLADLLGKFYETRSFTVHISSRNSGCKVMASPAVADPVGEIPAAWRGPHRGTLGPSPPPSGREPIKRHTVPRRLTHPISDADYAKPTPLPHGGGASRLGSQSSGIGQGRGPHHCHAQHREHRATFTVVSSFTCVQGRPRGVRTQWCVNGQASEVCNVVCARGGADEN